MLVGLDLNDFALVIQTSLQREVLQTCSSNRVVCIDATHGTNGYDFKLISMLVVDEFGEGFPRQTFVTDFFFTFKTTMWQYKS